jgi:hypothetical protein
MPDGHWFPQLPQFLGSDCRFTQAFPATAEGQIWPGGQQNGLIPGGGMAKPGVLSATCPGGQQISSDVLKRGSGQQTRGEFRVSPLWPGRI